MNRPVHCLALAVVISLVASAAAAQTPHGGHAAPATTDGAILFDDLGTHHHAVTTSSKQAQAFFDQGLRLVYAFNHDEAVRSFHEAARLDPNCAMAWWGIAYAHGPNYNLPLDDERNRMAFQAMQKAIELAPKASAKEQDYIGALQVRYSLDPKAKRKELDRAFADSMRALAKKYPDDMDAATLFAESMMDLRPWDLWTADRKPQPGTEEILATLEAVLAKNPDHPGANHYYIHSTEASPNPKRALASAERLKTLVPGAGHLVHMPSHVYMRTGDYAAASEANRKAIEVDKRYLAQAKPAGVYPMMYVPHNVHFLWASASMQGRSAEAIAAAREVTAQVTPEMMREMPMLEYFSPTLLFALARFGHWDEILGQPAPPDDLLYTKAMRAYARGLAFAATGKPTEAEVELALLKNEAERMPKDRIVGDNVPARSLLLTAQHTLAGEIAARQSKTEPAVRELRKAIELQDALPYAEPPPWYYPVRQSLGAVLLEAGRPHEAANVYREDLKLNPNNGWSTFGLFRALYDSGQKQKAYFPNMRFEKQWKDADVKLKSSRF